MGSGWLQYFAKYGDPRPTRALTRTNTSNKSNTKLRNNNLVVRQVWVSDPGTSPIGVGSKFRASLWYLCVRNSDMDSGRTNIVLGTHTHVHTPNKNNVWDDARLLLGITDIILFHICYDYFPDLCFIDSKPFPGPGTSTIELDCKINCMMNCLYARSSDDGHQLKFWRLFGQPSGENAYVKKKHPLKSVQHNDFSSNFKDFYWFHRFTTISWRN